ncbi:peroxiredoxin [Swingsia samuiensis]|uniref:thioredoxin-dependent peroxiredoxin n=1 Tax=Swingsia samuiensis TaxID=1293412 RepID=A0A4Y6UMW8_9PROT|nr:peroxiredoxin [Swingsia samuiensis]
MRSVLSALFLGCIFSLNTPAFAALDNGAKAPDFTAQASLGGHVFSYHLASALKKGPVVLYFYPAAFTPGCTIEAHEFAGAIPDFKALNATVIGISMDPLSKLVRFSVSECRNAFAVAADPNGKITNAYKAKQPLQNTSSRTSYIIMPNGRIAFSYAAMSPDEHVEKILQALKSLEHKH